MKVAGYIVLGLLSAMFLMSGFSKVTNAQAMVDMFQHYGYGDAFRVLIGILEIVSAILLWVPRVSRYAAALLGLVMIGATVTHFVFNEAVSTPLTIVLFLILAVTFVIKSQQKNVGVSQQV